MKKFLMALCGAGLIFGLAGCKIEIIDKDDKEEDKVEDSVEDSLNEVIKFTTLNDVLTYLNGENVSFECDILVETYLYMALDDSEDEQKVVFVGMDGDMKIDKNISYFNGSMVVFGMPMVVEQYVDTKTDGSTDTYTNVGDEWVVENSTNMFDDESEETVVLLESHFELVEGQYVTTTEAEEELGMELSITIADDNFTITMYQYVEEFDELYGSMMYSVIEFEGMNFSKVNLSLPEATPVE